MMAEDLDISSLAAEMILQALRPVVHEHYAIEGAGAELDELDIDGNGAATKRIVYLADQLDIDLPAREELVASFTSGYSLLDPTRPDIGSTDSTYRLQINVEPATLESTES
jgi:predicted transcriptional regulator of viral defense system